MGALLLNKTWSRSCAISAVDGTYLIFVEKVSKWRRLRNCKQLRRDPVTNVTSRNCIRIRSCKWPTKTPDKWRKIWSHAYTYQRRKNRLKAEACRLGRPWCRGTPVTLGIGRRRCRAGLGLGWLSRQMDWLSRLRDREVAGYSLGLAGSCFEGQGILS